MASPADALAAELAREAVQTIISRVLAVELAVTEAKYRAAAREAVHNVVSRVLAAAEAKSMAVAACAAENNARLARVLSTAITRLESSSEVDKAVEIAEEESTEEEMHRPQEPSSALMPSPPSERPTGRRPAPPRPAAQWRAQLAAPAEESHSCKTASILEAQPTSDFGSDFPSMMPSKQLQSSGRPARLDARAELERDREILQKRHLENLHKTRERQREPPSARRRIVVRDFVAAPGQPPLFGMDTGPSQWVQERLKGQREKRHRAAAQGIPSARSLQLPRKPPRDDNNSPRLASEVAATSPNGWYSREPLTVLESVELAMRHADEQVPEAVLDEYGITAFFDMYKTTVSPNRRADDEKRAGRPSAEEPDVPMPDLMGESRRDEPGYSIDLTKTVSKILHPGLAAFQTPKNPWHWPRRGGVPPMESAVVALLKGKPPPKQASPQEALAARQELNLPVIEKVKQVALWPDPAAKAQPKKGRERREHIKASPGLK